MATMIDTCLRIDGAFISIRDFSGVLPDKNYVEGAIICKINDCDVFTTDHWDLIDQLWVYVINGLSKAVRGESFETYFPDQPLRLRFDPISSTCLKVTVGHSSLNVDTQTFLLTMKHGAINFFSRMKQLNPEALETWDRYEKDANALIT